MSMSKADIALDAINTLLDKYGVISENDRSNLDRAVSTLYDAAEVKPVVKLPKVHQFYTTYSRAGYFREDVIRALSDAGCDYQENE